MFPRQLNFLNKYDLGYNQANLIYLPLNGEAKNKQEALRQEFNGIYGVVNFTHTDRVPFYDGNSSWGFDWQGKDPENKVLICSMQADRNYFKTVYRQQIWNPINIKLRDTFIKSKLFFALHNPISFSVKYVA